MKYKAEVSGEGDVVEQLPQLIFVTCEVHQTLHFTGPQTSLHVEKWVMALRSVGWTCSVSDAPLRSPISHIIGSYPAVLLAVRPS